MPRKSATIIPVAPVERLMIASGAERVSRDGAEALATLLAKEAELVSRDALVRAKQSGRATVRAEDIEDAAKHLL